MQKVFSSMRDHIKDNATHASNHLKSNSGDGYIWFLFMTVAFLLIFGALFTIMYTAVDMKNIRNDVDEAANDVFAHIREVAYDQITDGSTTHSAVRLTNADVMQMMAQHLNAQYSGNGLEPFIYKLDARDKLTYRIDNFEFTYIHNIHSENNKLTYKMGDVSGNNVVDSEDVQLIIDFIKGNPLEFPPEKCDINEDGTVDEKDVLMCEGLVKYYAENPDDTSATEQEDYALLMITFQVTVDISYGTMRFGTSQDNYHYYSILSFKPAH